MFMRVLSARALIFALDVCACVCPCVHVHAHTSSSTWWGGDRKGLNTSAAALAAIAARLRMPRMPSLQGIPQQQHERTGCSTLYLAQDATIAALEAT